MQMYERSASGGPQRPHHHKLYFHSASLNGLFVTSDWHRDANLLCLCTHTVCFSSKRFMLQPITFYRLKTKWKPFCCTLIRQMLLVEQTCHILKEFFYVLTNHNILKNIYFKSSISHYWYKMIAFRLRCK